MPLRYCSKRPISDDIVNTPCYIVHPWFPAFDNVEPPLDYVDVLPLQAVQMELEEEDDAAIYDWFYDAKPLGTSPRP